MDEEVTAVAQISQKDLDDAEDQAELIATMIADYESKRLVQIAENENTAATDAILAELEKQFANISTEAKEYDYLLNPRARPKRCTLCNDHPFVDMPDTTCGTCGNALIKARPPAGMVNWICGDEIAPENRVTTGGEPE